MAGAGSNAGGFNAGNPDIGGLLCRAGMWRARYQSHVGRAIKTRLGKSVSLGKPVLIGRASTKGPLGEPVRYNASARSVPLGTGTLAAPAWRHSAKCLLGTVPARHCKCLLGLLARHIYLQVPAWHCACSACLPRCALGTGQTLNPQSPSSGLV